METDGHKIRGDFQWVEKYIDTLWVNPINGPDSRSHARRGEDHDMPLSSKVRTFWCVNTFLEGCIMGYCLGTGGVKCIMSMRVPTKM